MGIADLRNVLNVFGGAELSPEARRDLLEEVALMMLSRATSTDTNIQPIEVETAQRALRRVTGKSISDADIRVAAKSEVFEKAPLDKYLAKAAKNIDLDDRIALLRALSEVIKADVRVSEREVEFFNMVANALNVSAASMVGLTPDPV